MVFPNARTVLATPIKLYTYTCVHSYTTHHRNACVRLVRAVAVGSLVNAMFGVVVVVVVVVAVVVGIVFAVVDVVVVGGGGGIFLLLLLVLVLVLVWCW